MNRRGFLGLLGGAFAGVALDRVIPFGRVWSFPKEIVIAPAPAITEPFHLAFPWDAYEKALTFYTRANIKRLDRLIRFEALSRGSAPFVERLDRVIRVATIPKLPILARRPHFTPRLRRELRPSTS
jgi:hypothetical protein